MLNHDSKTLEFDLRLEAGADFADLFEVKDALAKKGDGYRRIDADTLVLGYRRDDFVRETRIRVSREAEIDDDGFTFRLRLEPHSEWNTCVFAQPVTDRALAIKYEHDEEEAKPNIGMSLDQFLDAAPKLETDWDPLEHIYERSLIDLAALRFYSELAPEAALPAAGLPWFMTVFGRDSLITSFQALPFTPELAETTLRVLAARQATEVDDFRDAEPGKILHEIRFGELTRFDERPHSPYFGTADATPLFLVLVAETELWTGNAELVRDLQPAARAALEWIDRHGDADGDGYVEYERRNRFYALALDGEKRPVDSITSNVGHLLWSGIVDDDKADAVVERLLGDALFSGRGIRTMAEGEVGYNPIRYHNGTVWPHDNSLIALGLAGYGYRAEAARIAFAILEAATFFRYRLPEVFAGYRRTRTGFPVEYPTASSPQAWATGTPLVLLRVLLGLEPDGDELGVEPALPDGIDRVELRRIPGRWGRVNASSEIKEVVG